jgi:hypothetical protein
MSFAPGRYLFFKLFLAYTRQLEFISVKLLVLGSSADAQLKYAGMGEAGGQGGRLPTQILTE